MSGSGRRIFLLVLDSLGVGALPDADRFGDGGAHTLDHLVQAAGGLDAPHLLSLGLGNIAGVTALAGASATRGCFGRMAEVSAGKDTPTGHWEMMGCPLDWAFPTFPQGFDAELLERIAVAAGREVVGVGKIEDLFCGRGLTRAIHTEGNADGMRVTLELADTLDAGLVFVNLVDFDSLFGHRRDPVGYRGALEAFDAELGSLLERLRPDDLVLLTADHGNDPTFTATTDHTREYVPILAAGPGVRPGTDLGTRSTFADLGATVEEALGLAPTAGTSFLGELVP